MLNVDLDKRLEQSLDALAEKTNRSREHITNEALKSYIRQEEARDYEDQESLARWGQYQETGEVISNDDMIDWLNSWGKEQEQPCPVK